MMKLADARALTSTTLKSASAPLFGGAEGPRLGRLRSLAPRIAALFAAGLAALSAANFLWALLAPHAAQPGTTPPIAAPASDETPTLEALARVNPFAAAAPGETAATAAGAEIRETTLDLTLSGVRAIGERDGAAIIRVRGEERPVTVGETILPGVVLNAVEADRAIIARAGVLEAVSLGRETAGGLRKPAGPTSLSIKRETASRRSSAGADDTAVGAPADPARLSAAFANAVQIKPVFEGGSAGLALQPGANADAFAAAGFEPGDVLVSVAGVRIGADPTRAFAAIEALRPGEAVAVTVSRAGRRVQLSIDPSSVE